MRGLKRFAISVLFAVPIAVMVLFALANTEDVVLNGPLSLFDVDADTAAAAGDRSGFWTFLIGSVAAPAYLLALGTFFVGLIFGACLLWLNGIRARRRTKRAVRRSETLAREVEELRRKIAETDHAARPRPTGPSGPPVPVSSVAGGLPMRGVDVDAAARDRAAS